MPRDYIATSPNGIRYIEREPIEPDEEEEFMNSEICTCGTCGFQWRRGINGSHSCALTLSDMLYKVIPAANRLIVGKYTEWQSAGGGEECEHGYNIAIPCPACDLALFRKVEKFISE